MNAHLAIASILLSACFSVAVSANESGITEESRFIMACQQIIIDENVVVILEQEELDGGKFVNIADNKFANDEIDFILRYYEGDLKNQSMEEIITNGKLINEIRGAGFRLDRINVRFVTWIDGIMARMHVKLNKLHLVSFLQLDGNNPQIFECDEPTHIDHPSR